MTTHFLKYSKKIAVKGSVNTNATITLMRYETQELE